MPQAANLNRGAWKTMENEWADWVNNGYRVDYNIDVYPPGAVRPDSFEVEYTVSNPADGSGRAPQLAELLERSRRDLRPRSPRRHAESVNRSRRSSMPEATSPLISSVR